MTTSRDLGHLAACDVGEALGPDSILVVPLGAVEQHGPHLPLATDTLIVEAYTHEVLRRVGEELDIWRLPTLAVTKSNEHAWAAGTMWLSPESLLAVVRDLGRSVAATPARTLVFLNGHGGNTSVLDAACRELRLSHGLRTYLVHPFLPADHGGAGDADERGLGIHGGVGETSLMLHLHPTLVHMDRARPALPEFLEQFRHVRFGGTVSFGWTSQDFDSEGVIGDPTLASAERGAIEFERGAQYLEAVFREISVFRLPGEGHAHR